MQAIVEAALASVTIASQSVPESIQTSQAGLAPSANASSRLQRQHREEPSALP